MSKLWYAEAMRSFTALTIGRCWFIFFAIFVFFLPLLEVQKFSIAVLVGTLLLFVKLLSKDRVLIVIILLSLALHAQWGIAQFVLQGDLNLRLLGETELANTKTGVAKFGVDKILRAYGPYMHANSFGGVMSMALVLLAFLGLGVSVKSPLGYLSPLFVLAILVSFSRSALLSVFLLLLIMVIRRRARIFWGNILLVSILCLLVFMPFYIDRFTDPLDAGVSERFSGYAWSLRIIENNGLWRGLGNVSYKDVLRSTLERSGLEYLSWQVDYVHSVPLLIVAVFGLVPSLVFFIVSFIWLMNRKFGFGLLLLGAIAPLALLDHYLVTQISPFVMFLLLLTI